MKSNNSSEQILAGDDTVYKTKKIKLQTQSNSDIDVCEKVNTATKNIDTSNNIYLKPLEACTLLRIALSTLYAWVHERRVPFYKHGRLLLFRKDLLLEWSDRQAVMPREEPSVFNIHRKG